MVSTQPIIPSGDAAAAVLEEKIKQQLSRLPAEALGKIVRYIQESLINEAQPPADSCGRGTNRRREQRLRVVATGTIFYHGRTSTMPCDIRDISSFGCRVSVASTVELPRQFELRISGTESLRLCVTKWRLPAELGILFADRQATADP